MYILYTIYRKERYYYYYYIFNDLSGAESIVNGRHPIKCITCRNHPRETKTHYNEKNMYACNIISIELYRPLFIDMMFT